MNRSIGASERRRTRAQGTRNIGIASRVRMKDKSKASKKLKEKSEILQRSVGFTAGAFVYSRRRSLHSETLDYSDSV